MRKILITGGGGHLGRVLTPYLKSKQYETYSTSLTASKRYVDTALDVCNKEAIDQIISKINPDTIFHLASTYSKNFHDSYKINFESSQSLLDIVARASNKIRVVLIGSAAEYGKVGVQDSPIHEDFKLAPVSTYGLTKSFQSLLVKYYHEMGVNVLYARIFNLYGDEGHMSLLTGSVLHQIDQIKKGLIDKIVTGPLNQQRDFISMDDASMLLEKIAIYGDSGEIYHIGSGQPLLCRDWVHRVMRDNQLDPAFLLEEKGLGSSSVESIFADMTKTNNILRQRKVPAPNG